MALALQNLGIDARSWLGWQIPIRTDGVHGKARIEAIETAGARASALAKARSRSSPGFRGSGRTAASPRSGRGGSDTSAVALAAALKADRCDIFTDVDGVYTTDPRIVAKARKLDRITYEEMLEMASQGARVLQTRSVEMAMNHRVRVQVLSSFTDTPGTLVVDEDEIVEKQVVSGIAYSRDEAKITVQRVADRPGVAAAIFGPLADDAINVDMIVQNVSEDGSDDRPDLHRRRAAISTARCSVLEEQRKTLGFDALKPDSNVVKISVIGVGMRSHAGVAQLMFKTLAEHGHQHPGDLDLRDQGQRADRRRIHRAGAARAAHRLRARRRRMTAEFDRRRSSARLARTPSPPLTPARGRARSAVGARPRLPRHRARHHGRRDDLGVGAQPGRGDLERRRVRRDCLGVDVARAARRGDRRDRGADRTGRSASI